ncbi:MAG: hypothetical protein [Caudoviricetes sp.]|nr:MAG: hypothetical protein [Caudoviricetes sp.]
MYAFVYYTYMTLCFLGALYCLSSICKGKTEHLVYTKSNVVWSHAISVTSLVIFGSMFISGLLLVVYAIFCSVNAYLISLRKLSVGSTTISAPDFIRSFFKCILKASVISFLYYGSINQWFSTISASSLYQWASALPTSG